MCVWSLEKDRVSLNYCSMLCDLICLLTGQSNMPPRWAQQHSIGTFCQLDGRRPEARKGILRSCACELRFMVYHSIMRSRLIHSLLEEPLWHPNCWLVNRCVQHLRVCGLASWQLLRRCHFLCSTISLAPLSQSSSILATKIWFQFSEHNRVQ